MPSGSGDTTYNYVQIFVWVIISFLFAVTWVLLDRKHTSYRRLAYWLRIFMRYYLGYTLLVYGFVKIIKLQFPSPGLVRLVQPYGDSSPMGLAWTFVGFSNGYNMYIGGAEVLAGSLLFFKRTTLLGSLLSMTVMMNVAAMNFAYDIPVKLFSLNLVLFSVYLAAFDWQRIRNVFFLNRPAVYSFSYSQPDKDHLLFAGRSGNDIFCYRALLGAVFFFDAAFFFAVPFFAG